MSSFQDDSLEWIYEIMAESERGGVLVACAYLEEQLTDLLKAHFLDDEKAINSLMRPSGPLGAFSTKIKLCYLLQLIDSESYSHLETIRGIRNDFAHSHFSLTFKTDSIKDRMAAIAQDFTSVSGLEEIEIYPITIKTTGRPTSRPMNKEYWRFIFIVSSLSGTVTRKIASLKAEQGAAANP